MNYPDTKRSDIVEEKFGGTIADPYRWLENDIRTHADVAGWVETQNGLSAPYLSGLNGRDIFHQRLTALYDHQRLTVPAKKGGRYFFTRNSGLDNQSILFVREGVTGEDRIVVNPNDWSEDGTSALAEWAPSEDGTHLAFAIQEAGADWRTIRILDIESGVILDDAISWARFTSIAWVKDGSGFFYTRNPKPDDDATFQSPVLGHAVYFHRLGTAQSEDRLIHAPDADRPMIHTVKGTPERRYVVIYSTPLTGGNALSVIDLSDPAWPVRTIIETFDDAWTVAGNVGSKLFLTTQNGAERGKIVTLDLDDDKQRFIDIVEERPDATLQEAAVIGNRLVVSHFVDAVSQVRLHKLDGSPDGEIDLPGIGTAGAFRGQYGDDEGFFVFTSHASPTTIFRYEAASNTSTVFAEPEIPVDLDGIEVEQRFYRSKDGTKVPIFIMRQKGSEGPLPTMLTAYGGFGIPMVPFFLPEAIAWAEQGGVFAVANIRGGGEYGRTWHDAGRLKNKQNVFDDFIAAGEFLKAEGITAPDGLAIHGSSNGGLLVGSVVNQRPELFAVAIPNVGVLDMLRFDRFTSGELWKQEYGDPSVEDDFRYIRSYSPLHNIRDRTAYPAILVTTADTDDRVVPGHSFKYVAALQATELGSRPRLIRIETKAGHGGGKPTRKVIDEVADVWAFAAHWTGLAVTNPN